MIADPMPCLLPFYLLGDTVNPLDWLLGRPDLAPGLRCVRCAKQIQVSESVVSDADLGFAHTSCLLEYERARQD